MKRLKLERGKEVLNSTGGNHLCGHFLRGPAREHPPTNFQNRRSDAISDRDVLLTMTGMLCNARTDFTDANLYADDTGNDAEENFAHFGEEFFIIKRNLRRAFDPPRQVNQTALRQVLPVV